MSHENMYRSQRSASFQAKPVKSIFEHTAIHRMPGSKGDREIKDFQGLIYKSFDNVNLSQISSLGETLIPQGVDRESQKVPKQELSKQSTFPNTNLLPMKQEPVQLMQGGNYGTGNKNATPEDLKKVSKLPSGHGSRNDTYGMNQKTRRELPIYQQEVNKIVKKREKDERNNYNKNRQQTKDVKKDKKSTAKAFIAMANSGTERTKPGAISRAWEDLVKQSQNDAGTFRLLLTQRFQQMPAEQVEELVQRYITEELATEELESNIIEDKRPPSGEGDGGSSSLILVEGN
jgi:flagellar biosynthesis GTPase FlhF